MEYVIIMHKPTGEMDRLTREEFDNLSTPWEYTVIGSDWE